MKVKMRRKICVQDNLFDTMLLDIKEEINPYVEIIVKIIGKINACCK